MRGLSSRGAAGLSQSHWLFFPLYEYWGEVKWFQLTHFLTGTNLLGSPVGDLELWDLRALVMPVSTRKGSSYQPLPAAKCLGLCSSLSRYSNPLDLNACYSRTSTPLLRALPGVKLAKVCIYFGGPKERKMCHFRAGCWAFLEGAEHPQLQGLSTGVDNAQCQSWNEGYY